MHHWRSTGAPRASGAFAWPRVGVAAPRRQAATKSSFSIWLCAKCARMIDRDATRYTVAVLREWKTDAEQRARVEIESGPAPPRPESSALRHIPDDGQLRVAQASLEVLVRALAHQGHNVHLTPLAKGSEHCPRAFSGIGLPLLVLRLEHVVVVVNDSGHGLRCHVVDATDLHRDSLSVYDWTPISDPSRADEVVKSVLVGKLTANAAGDSVPDYETDT